MRVTTDRQPGTDATREVRGEHHPEAGPSPVASF
jgi:hypothetical protein